MRPIWKGYLTFGLVHVPVSLAGAVQEAEGVHFRQLHRTDLSPIRYRRVCEAEGKEVPWADIVKGYEIAKGEFVVLDDADFKAAALTASKAIEILDFVPEAEVDARYFEKPYVLLAGKGGEKAYALLREAIRRTGTVGIGTLTLRANAHHLVAVKVVGDALLAEVMRFQNELVDMGEYAFPSAESVRPQELRMAEQLIANLSASFEPAKYRDEYRERVLEIIRAKAKGERIEVAPGREPESTRVVDLMARLEESLALGRGAAAPGSGTGRRGRAARKEPKAKRAASAVARPARGRRGGQRRSA